MRQTLKKAIDNLDITLAALGCILAVPLTLYLQVALHRPIYVATGVICFFAFLGYLAIRRKVVPSLVTQMGNKPRLYLLLNILFFCLLGYSIIALHLRPDLHARPPGYFMATIAMVALLPVEILVVPERKAATYFALFKIILIGVSLAWSQLIIFPNVLGMDPWYHQMFTTSIVDSGHIPESYAYSNLPCFHLIIGMTSLVAATSYKVATMASVSLLQVVCNALFIFLLGKFIHSAKVGLLAALLLMIATWHIRFSYWTTPNALAAIFIPIVIYTLFKLRQEKPVVSVCLLAVFLAVLIMTHTVTAVCMGMLLFLFWLAFEIYRRLGYRAAASGKVFLVVGILFTIATLSWWTFGSNYDYAKVLTNLARTGFSGEYFANLPPEAIPPEAIPPASIAPGAIPPAPTVELKEALIQYRNSVPFAEQLFNNVGYFLFFALAFIGSFAMLSKSTRNRHGFALVIGGLAILAVNFLGIVAHRGLLPNRWHYFSQVLLAIPVSIAFLWLTALARRESVRACLLGFAVCALSFLLIMSPLANTDNRAFSANTAVRYALTESELQAAKTCISVYAAEIGSDGYYPKLTPELGIDKKQLRERKKDIGPQLYSRDFSDCEGSLVLIRQEIVGHPFKPHRSGIYRLSYDPRQALTEQGFSRIYDCGSVSGFVEQRVKGELATWR